MGGEIGRELGKYAVWSLSTAKPGNGIEQLRDNSSETYWQSDGTQPHLVNVQFIKKVSVSKVCFYLDFGSDESYTPKKIAIRSGTSLHDLVDLTAIEVFRLFLDFLFEDYSNLLYMFSSCLSFFTKRKRRRKKC